MTWAVKLEEGVKNGWDFGALKPTILALYHAPNTITISIINPGHLHGVSSYHLVFRQ